MNDALPEADTTDTTVMKLQEVPNCHNITVTIWKWRTKNDNDQINYLAIRKGSSCCFIQSRISNSYKTVRSAKTSKSENVELPPLPRYVGTCKIMYEKNLATIRKSGIQFHLNGIFNPMPMNTHIAPECCVAQWRKRFVRPYSFIMLNTVNLKQNTHRSQQNDRRRLRPTKLQEYPSLPATADYC